MTEINVFSDGIYKSNRRLMTSIGVWPRTSAPWRILARYAVLALLISIMIPQYTYLIRARENLDDIVFGVIAQMSIYVALCKFYFIAINMNRVQSVLTLIEEDWRIITESNAVKKIHQYAGRVFVYSAAAFFLLSPLQTVILDFILPLNETRPRIFVLDADYEPYGFETNDHYYFATGHGFSTAMLVVHLITTVDTFVLIVVEHCCGLFEAVGSIMEQLELEPSSEKQYQMICNAIMIHQRAIDLAEFTESSFTIMYAVVVLLTMVLLSMTGFAAIIKIDRPAEVIRFGLYAAGLAMHLLFISLPGQELFDHSSRVAENVYSSDWSRICLRGQKLIGIMLMRSMKPLEMTAGGFYLMNLENFGNVLRTSMSYFTVLLSTR